MVASVHRLLPIVALVLTPGALAQPSAPAVFCDAYPDAPVCSSGEAACTTCHQAPPTLDLYGLDLAEVLGPGLPRPLPAELFDGRLAVALAAIEGADSDRDGWANHEEIAAGTSPSDPASTPERAACTDRGDDAWDMCGYDLDYAFTKVHLDFCGRSPTLAAKEAFAAAPDPTEALHDALDVCLDSEPWRGREGRVWNLANDKIRPDWSFKSGVDTGPVPLADYDDDYAYWVWTQTDDRDVRLVLTGTDFVRVRHEGGRTVYEPWSGHPEDDLAQRGRDRYQAVVEERRAGLLTHRWFLMANTMFTAIPRTTAAQAYRAFLGFDLSREEGLSPVPGEPADHDSKGVQAAECARCHATLDPLTYPFSRYEGIGNNTGFAGQYQYKADRMSGFVRSDGPAVVDTPEAGVLFGEPVADLVEWAAVAAESEAFHRALVLDYWQLLLQEPPRADEAAEAAALVDGLRAHHSIERMLHALVDTEAYGAP